MATRYDKLALRYETTIQIAATDIWLRHLQNAAWCSPAPRDLFRLRPGRAPGGNAICRDSGAGGTWSGCVYRHEIRPGLTTGATAMNKILSKKRPRTA